MVAAGKPPPPGREGVARVRALLQAVAQCGPAVSLAGSLVGSTGDVPADHLPGSPPRESHQDRLAVPVREPTVGERVAEPVRVDLRYSCLLCSPVQ
jgi:hypothetical protein